MDSLHSQPEPSTKPGGKRETHLRPNAAPARGFAVPKPSARILYVDDDAVLRALGQMMLVQSGYVVDTAADGLQGWETLQRAEYDLLVTDNEMPRLTGLELIRRTRRAGMSLPIVMASGSTDPLRNVAGQADPITFLPKPFDPEQLVSAIGEMLRTAEGKLSRPEMGPHPSPEIYQ